MVWHEVTYSAGRAPSEREERRPIGLIGAVAAGLIGLYGSAADSITDLPGALLDAYQALHPQIRAWKNRLPRPL
jgi:hypothetical protein